MPILTTNPSTLLRNNIVPFVKRPERFLALHAGNLVWEAPIGGVMGHPGTNIELFEQVLEFEQQSGWYLSGSRKSKRVT